MTTKKVLEAFGLATPRDLPEIEKLEDEAYRAGHTRERILTAP